MAYIGNAPGHIAKQVFRFLATAGQTTFSGLDANGLTLGYQRDALDLFVNGNLLTPVQDYAATDGSAIIVAAGLSAGDEVVVVARPAFSEADHYTKSAADVLLAGKANLASLGLRNRLINGNFDIWQRGTSITISAASTTGFTADRWRGYSASTFTASQQSFTPGQIDVPGEPTYFLRLGVSASVKQILQYVEDVRTFAGKQTVFSFWAKSSAPETVSVNFGQEFGSGGSAGFAGPGQSINLTTSWQKFTLIFDVPSIAGKTIGVGSYVYVSMGSGGTALAAGNTQDFAQAQWEEGAVATPFEHRPIGLELALCQRYYEVIDTNCWLLKGREVDRDRRTSLVWRVQKRASPSVTQTYNADGSGTLFVNPGIYGVWYQTMGGGDGALPSVSNIRADAEL